MPKSKGILIFIIISLLILTAAIQVASSPSQVLDRQDSMGIKTEVKPGTSPSPQGDSPYYHQNYTWSDAWNGPTNNPIPPPSVAHRNVVKNPGAETGNLSCWDLHAGGAGAFSVSTAEHYYGKYSFTTNVPSGGWADLYQNVSLTPSSRTLFMAALKINAVSPVQFCLVYIAVKVNGGQQKWLQYEVAESILPDIVTDYYFLIGKASGTWYYIMRNVTADCLYKGIGAPESIDSVHFSVYEETGGSTSAYFDSIYIGDDQVMSQGNSSWYNNEFEDPTLVDTSPDNYPIGWSGVVRYGTETKDNTQTSFSSDVSWLHYWSYKVTLGGTQHIYKDTYYEIGTNPPNYLFFSLRQDRAESGSSSIISVYMKDSSTGARLLYTFSGEGTSRHPEDTKTKVIHNYIPSATWITRIKLWKTDWNSTFGAPPDMSHIWQVFVGIWNPLANYPQTGYWDGIWMGDTFPPRYNSFLFSDTRSRSWYNDFNMPGEFNGLNQGFDYDGLFYSGDDTGPWDWVPQFTFYLPDIGSNFKAVTYQLGKMSVQSSGTGSMVMIDTQYMVQGGWDWDWNVAATLFYDGTRYYPDGSRITGAPSYSGDTYARFRIVYHGPINCMTGLKWFSIIIGDTTPPPQVTLISPLNNAVLGNLAPTFSWNAVTDIGISGLKTYQLQFATDQDFTSNVHTYNETSTHHAVTGLPAAKYFWRVRAVDNAENTGAWSLARVIDIWQEEKWTNRTVDGLEQYRDLWISLDGNLNITQNGGLSLAHCILVVNSTSPVQSGIMVYGGMAVRESSLITALKSSNPYYFTVYEGARFYMMDSQVEYCGYIGGSWPDQQGLAIRANDAFIENNTITHGYHGLILYKLTWSRVLGNNATNNLGYGFYLSGCSGSTVPTFPPRLTWNVLQDNTAVNNKYNYYLVESSANALLFNTATGGEYGFCLNRSSQNRLTSNIAENNIYGFKLEGGSGNHFSGNSATECEYGFYILGSSSNDFSGNIAANSHNCGFFLRGSSGNYLQGNNAENSVGNGFYLEISNGNRLYDNLATSGIPEPSYVGFTLRQSSENTLSNNEAKGFGTGFYLDNSWNNSISVNYAMNNIQGFVLWQSEDNTLSGNSVDSLDMGYGFYLDQSSNNTLSSNRATGGMYGFYIYNSSNNDFTANRAAFNDFAFYLSKCACNNLLDNIATNNFLGVRGDGGPYLFGCGFFLDFGSGNNTLSGNTVTDSDYGFLFYHGSDHNIVSKNTALNCTLGYDWSADSIGNDLTGSIWLNYLRVNVIFYSGSPISGVEINVTTDEALVYATQHFGGSNYTTDQNGLSPWIRYLYKTGTGINEMYENTTIVNVWHIFPWGTIAEFNDEGNPRTVHMSTSSVVTFKQKYAAETWTDLTIKQGEDKECKDTFITVQGTLTVNGTLHLINCVLSLNNGTFPLQYGVRVYGGMYMSLCYIVPANEDNPYYFTVYEGASFQMNNSWLFNCGNSIGSWPDQQGLAIRANNARIENNTIALGYHGLILYGSTGSTVLGNNATNNLGYGFYLSGSSGSTLSDNTASDNTVGFFYYGSFNNNVSGNTAMNNSQCGFYLRESWENKLTANTATNSSYGFWLNGSSDNDLLNNTATNNRISGFHLENSERNNLSSNTASDNLEYGFRLDNSSYNILSGNTASENPWGFNLNCSSHNTLTDNIAFNCTTGYSWSSSSNNNFTGSLWINYVRVFVKDSQGNAISGVNIKIETDGALVYATPHFGGSNYTTDQNGLSPWILVLYKTGIGIDEMHENTTVVTVWNSTAWFFDNQRIVSVSTRQTEVFMADTIPPEVTINTPIEGAFISTTQVCITWTGSDNGVIYRYYIRDGQGTWIDVGNAISYTFAGMSLGPHTVYVEVIDLSGLIDKAFVSFTVGPNFAVSTKSISVKGVGGLTYVYANVTNLGANYSGQITVCFYDISNPNAVTQIGSAQIILGLNHNELKGVSVSWEAVSSRTVQVIVDPQNTIAEYNENNNVAQIIVKEHRPVIALVGSQLGVLAGDQLGIFLTGLDIFAVDIYNTFTVYVTDNNGPNTVREVKFEINSVTYYGTRQWVSAQISCWVLNYNINGFKPGQNKLIITAIDDWEQSSQTRTVYISAVGLPSWITENFEEGLKKSGDRNGTGWEISYSLKDQKIMISVTIPSTAEDVDLENDREVPGDVPAAGGEDASTSAWFRLEVSYYLKTGTAEIAGGGEVTFNVLGNEASGKITVKAYLKPDLSFDNATILFTLRIPVYSFSGEAYFSIVTVKFGVAFGAIIGIEALIKNIENLGIRLIYALVDLGIWGKGWLQAQLDLGFCGARVTATILSYIHAVITFDFLQNQFTAYLEGKPGVKITWSLECWALWWSWSTSGVYQWDFRVGSPGVVNATFEQEPWSFVQDYTGFMDSRPRVATDGKGNAMMIWVQNRVEDGKTYSDICYSIWNGTGWGTPGYITSYGEQANFDPALTYDSNGNVIAVWSRITSAGDASEIFENQEIFYSIWDGTSWSTPLPITSNSYADGRAVVSAGRDGIVIAAWVRDLDHNFTTTSDMDLYYSIWDGTAWGPELPLTDNTWMDYSVTLDFDSKGNAIACWTSDADGNSTTYLDRQLMYAIWDGTSWGPASPVVQMDEMKDSPSVTFDLNDNALVTWVGGNETINRIYFASRNSTTGIWSEPEVVREDKFFIYYPAINVSPNNTAVIVWRGFQDDEQERLYYYTHNVTETYFDGEICYATKELSSPGSVWSDVKYLTSDNKTDWMASAVIIRGYSNDLLLVWDKEGVVSTLVHPLKPDLMVAGFEIIFSNNYPKEGENVSISATIRNIGDVEVYNTLVDFYDGDPNNGGHLIDTRLIEYVDYSGKVNVRIFWLAEPGRHDIYVVVHAQGLVSELNETNNIAYNTIMTLPDLTVTSGDIAFSSSDPSAGEQITISATIRNQGGASAENVPVGFYCNGVPIGSQTIQLLDPDEYAIVTTTWTVLAGSNNITVVIDPTGQIAEWNEENNNATTTILVLPDIFVSGINLSNNDLVSGESVDVSVELLNIGHADANGVVVEFFDGNPYADGSLIHTETVDISIGDTYAFHFVWTPPPGIHQVFVVADFTDFIAEEDEMNNLQYGGLSVRLVPDLTILEPEIALEAGQVEVIVPVQNLAEAVATNVLVGLYDGDPANGGVLIESQTVLHISAGEIVTLKMIVPYPPTYEYLFIVVDPENTIAETNETNNKASIKYMTAPVVNAGPDQTVNEGETVQFSGAAQVIGNLEDYTFAWNFGDGAYGEGRYPTHEYQDNGVYTVTLNVSLGAFFGTDRLTVTVLNVPPIVNAGPDQTVNEDETVSFVPTVFDPGADTFTYAWDFNGDGIVDSTLEKPTWTYTKAGVHTVSLTVTDDDGGVGADTLVVTVQNVPPTAEAGSDQTVNENQEIAFDASSSSDTPSDLPLLIYTWDFGDGATGTGITVQHVYVDPGAYTVTLTVVDDEGATNTDTCIVTVLDKTPPETTVFLEGVLGLNGWYRSPVNITLTAFDDYSVPCQTKYSFNETYWYTYDGSFTVSTDGVTKLYYRSIDNAGNVEIEKSTTIPIDKTPPTITRVLQGEQGLRDWYKSDVTITLSAADPMPGSGWASTEYSLDGINWTQYETPFTISYRDITTVYYRSTDNAGNTQEESVEVKIYIVAQTTIGPQTLNLKSNGQWVTVCIELPQGYNPNEIDISSVELRFGDKTIHASWGQVEDGVLMVKFDRAALIDMLSCTEPNTLVQLEIWGEVAGCIFAGTVTVRVI